MIRIEHGELFSFDADALVLPFDGEDSRDLDHRVGNTARALASRWTDTFGAMQDAVGEKTVEMGQVVCVELPEGDPSPWNGVILASTLKHLDQPSVAQLEIFVRRATVGMVRVARQRDWGLLASPVLSGGWRLQPEAALISLVAGYREAMTKLQKPVADLSIVENSPERYELLRAVWGRICR